jgi:hypothetical protein
MQQEHIPGTALNTRDLPGVMCSPLACFYRLQACCKRLVQTGGAATGCGNGCKPVIKAREEDSGPARGFSILLEYVESTSG